MLEIDPKDAVPIWRQIEEGVRRLVSSGALRSGVAVPSVREMARDLRVNPMTVSKAYQRLSDGGVLEVRRGEGTYVASGAPQLSRGERTQELRTAARRFVALAVTLGAARDETARELEAAWELTLRRRGGDR